MNATTMHPPLPLLPATPVPPGTQDVMIDLETLSTRADAAITSIGAVWFNPSTQEVGTPLHLVVDMANSIATGGHVCGDTLRWWLQQSDAARQAICQPGVPLAEALQTLACYLSQVAPLDAVRVHANGADFDLPILASACHRLSLPVPWRYYNQRCMRTLCRMYPQVEAPITLGTEHNAADDALHQALHALQIMQVHQSVQLVRTAPALPLPDEQPHA